MRAEERGFGGEAAGDAQASRFVVDGEARVPVTLVTDVGVRLPAQLPASGRSILAHLSAAQVRALFPASTAFVARTGRGPASLPGLRQLLAAERTQGWAE
ncbi:IclR family transcriptional regulator domain-containing protein [Mycobacterium sp. NPDC004974]